MRITKTFEWFHDGQVTVTVDGDWVEGSYVTITLENDSTSKTLKRKVRYNTTACDLSFTLENQKFFLMDFNDEE